MLFLRNAPLELTIFYCILLIRSCRLRRETKVSLNIHPSRHHYWRSRGTCVAEKSSHVSVLRAEHGRYGYYGAVLSLGDMKSIVGSMKEREYSRVKHVSLLTCAMCTRYEWINTSVTAWSARDCMKPVKHWVLNASSAKSKYIECETIYFRARFASFNFCLYIKIKVFGFLLANQSNPQLTRGVSEIIALSDKTDFD